MLHHIQFLMLFILLLSNKQVVNQPARLLTTTTTTTQQSLTPQQDNRLWILVDSTDDSSRFCYRPRGFNRPLQCYNATENLDEIIDLCPCSQLRPVLCPGCLWTLGIFKLNMYFFSQFIYIFIY